MNKFKLFPYKLDNIGVNSRSYVVTTNLLMDLHEFHTFQLGDKHRLEKVHKFNCGLPSCVRKLLLMNYGMFIKPTLMSMRFEDTDYLIRCTRVESEKWLIVHYWHV